MQLRDYVLFNTLHPTPRQVGVLKVQRRTTQVTRMQSKTRSAFPGIASRPRLALAPPAYSASPASISLSLLLEPRGEGVGKFLICESTRELLYTRGEVNNTIETQRG